MTRPQQTPERSAEPALIFLGPTLPPAEAALVLDAVYRPPARRGDIYRALRDEFRTIVLIDGVFHGQPSVWQREILDAVAEGAVVHGASSMGALRAAELHGYGMIGHGKIFEWYRDGVIEADDEVALTYGPQELGYPSLSEPLVNIRATLAQAVPELISADQRDELIAYVRARHFSERSFARLLNGGPSHSWPAERRATLADFLSRSRIDQKRCDALDALRAVAADPGPHRATNDITGSSAIWCRERIVAEGYAANIEAIDPAGIVRQTGIAADDLADLRRELSEAFFVAIQARACGIAVTPNEIEAARCDLQPTRDLSPARVEQLVADQAAATAAVRTLVARDAAADPRSVRRALILEWAKTGGIEHEGLEGKALVDWIVEAGPNHFGYWWWPGVELLHALRLRGRIAVPRSEAGL